MTRSNIGPVAERRLAELAVEHRLPGSAPPRLRALLTMLARDPHAPTTVRQPERAVDVHVADALSALALSAVQRARRAADLGSGAGVPGLVLAVARPGLGMALVESARRRADYLHRAAEAVDRPGVEVVGARAEDWQAGLGLHDLICARALASLPVVAEYAAPLLAVGGVLVAWRGRRDAADEHAGALAAAELGLECLEVRRVKPFAGATDRHLHVLRKVSATPPRFPRRPGMARKRPLGATPRVGGRPGDADGRLTMG